MKTIYSMIPSFIKAIIGVVGFIISLGWAAYGSVYLIVKAEGQDIRREFLTLDKKNMQHIDRRFDELKELVKERK